RARGAVRLLGLAQGRRAAAWPTPPGSRRHQAAAAHRQSDRCRPSRGGPDPDYRIRLAGTGLYSVYGREITGKRLGDVYNTAAADYWRAELGKVVAERRPAVGAHNMGWRGASHLSILWLRLPLATNGSEVDMILGFDAVVGMSQFTSGIRAA
ncbi:MAG TPA: PAS domain-containing protein, partial [Phenylobacterium sp.]